MELRFGVLGPLASWRGGAPVQVPSGRRRAVLACLLAHVGRPVGPDVLLEAAWGEEQPDRPRAALNTVVSRLRTLLGDDVVRSHPAGYLLDVPREAVDAARFEALRESAAGATPDEARKLLDEALALWRGPAYAEYAEHDFAALEAQRLDLLRLESTEALSSLCLESGDVESAVAGLEWVLAEQPFREQALHLLMTALYRGGRATEALARFRSHRRVLADELGLDPSPALQDLESRILGHDVRPTTTTARPVSRAPAWLDRSTAFVGRDDSIRELADALARNRLVTITGPGGVGKTRLAAEALPEVVHALGSPATVVELARVRTGAAGAALAEALAVGGGAGDLREACLEYLTVSGGLLVLDNCEHLLDEVADLAEGIGRRCPGVRILATSRHRLGLPTELVLPLEPLTTPAEGADAQESATTPAVRLFADRVRRARPTADPVAEDPATAGEICRHLEGLPLAVELAAARAAVLGVGTLRDQLVHHDDGGLVELAAVVDWSCSLLDPVDRRLFAVLSVFVDTFDAAAVEEVVHNLAVTGDRTVTRGLAELAEASLLDMSGERGEVRYRILTPVRVEAARRLADSGERDAVRLAHATWVRDQVDRAATDHGPLSDLLDPIRSDITAALRWSVDAGHWSLAGDITGALALCRPWPAGTGIGDLTITVAQHLVAEDDPACGPVAAGSCVLADRGELERSRQWATRALGLDERPTEHYLARLAPGVASIYAGEHEESRRWWTEITTIDDLAPARRAEGHLSLSLIATYSGDPATAHEQAEVALALTELSGSSAAHAFALYAAGEAAVKRDLAEGELMLARAAAEADRTGADHVSRVARLARLAALVRLGRHPEATALVTPLLDDCWRAGAWPQVWTTMRILAELLVARGQDRDAAFLLAAADTADGAPPPLGDDVARYECLTENLSGALGPTVMAGIRQLATGQPRSQVVDRARVVLEGLRE